MSFIVYILPAVEMREFLYLSNSFNYWFIHSLLLNAHKCQPSTLPGTGAGTVNGGLPVWGL